MGRPMRWMAALLLMLGSAACSSSGRGQHDCTKPCTGSIDNAAYAIRMPRHWNGTLLLFSHSYRPPGARLAHTPALSIYDNTGRGDDAVSQALLAKGYALAGSSYARQGWAASDAIAAADALYRRFVTLEGKPKRTYAWGASLGGLVTELLTERATWVDGAGALCGAVGGSTANFDNLYRAAFAVKTLLAPQLRVSGFASLAAAEGQERIAARVLAAAMAARGAGEAAALYVADLVGMPTKTARFASGGPGASAAAEVGALQRYLALWYVIEPDIEQRFGGLPAAPWASIPELSATQAAAITALHGDVGRLRTRLASAATPSTDQQARAAAAAAGDPSGRLRAPLITLHDVYDPLVLVANESLLRGLVAKAGKSERLVQSYVTPAGSSIGLGHCSFTVQQVVGTLTVLDSWVRTGTEPTQQAVAKAAGAGIAQAYQSPAWPG